MDNIYIGKVVNTHGIKGEIRILSDFEYKDNVFKPGNTLLIGDREYTIKTYRVHKNYDMITIDGYDNINDVLHLLKNKVYIKRERLDSNITLDDELLSYKLLTNDLKEGIIKEIFFASSNNKIIRGEIDGKEVLIPFNDVFVKNIDKDKNTLTVELIGGMTCEN